MPQGHRKIAGRGTLLCLDRTPRTITPSHHTVGRKRHPRCAQICAQIWSFARATSSVFSGANSSATTGCSGSFRVTRMWLPPSRSHERPGGGEAGTKRSRLLHPFERQPKHFSFFSPSGRTERPGSDCACCAGGSRVTPSAPGVAGLSPHLYFLVCRAPPPGPRLSRFQTVRDAVKHRPRDQKKNQSGPHVMGLHRRGDRLPAERQPVARRDNTVFGFNVQPRRAIAPPLPSQAAPCTLQTLAMQLRTTSLRRLSARRVFEPLAAPVDRLWSVVQAFLTPMLDVPDPSDDGLAVANVRCADDLFTVPDPTVRGCKKKCNRHRERNRTDSLSTCSVQGRCCVRRNCASATGRDCKRPGPAFGW